MFWVVRGRAPEFWHLLHRQAGSSSGVHGSGRLCLAHPHFLYWPLLETKCHQLTLTSVRLAVARRQCWPDLWWRRAGDRCELIPDTFGSTHREECSLSSLQNSQASQFPCKTLSVWMGRGPTQCFYRGLKSPAFQPLPWSRPLSVFWGAENILSSGSLLSPKH